SPCWTARGEARVHWCASTERDETRGSHRRQIPVAHRVRNGARHMAVPTTMTAIEITAPGGPEALQATTRPVPKPGAGEILTEVHAAGINRPDVLQRMGKYEPPPGTTDIPGLEAAGIVAALGEGVSGFKLGDKVCALLAGGG